MGILSEGILSGGDLVLDLFKGVFKLVCACMHACVCVCALASVRVRVRGMDALWCLCVYV